MEWEEIKTAFDWDGSLRDVYVFDTTIDDWARLIDFVKAREYTLRFARVDKEPLPADVNLCFLREPASLLMIDIGGITLNAHFFAREEIELDLDPREVRSMAKAEVLFDFMRGLGQALGKPVRMTPENQSDYVLYLYEPMSDELTRERE